jgi:hypothetical protein
VVEVKSRCVRIIPAAAALLSAASARQVSHRSHDAVIQVLDDAANLIETHEHWGEFKEW